MAEILILRLIHVLAGMFWVGAALFTGIYLMPALAQAGGPAAGPIMNSMRSRHLFTVMPAVGILTILAGFRLMWITSGGFQASYFRTGHGVTFTGGGAAALLAFIIGMAVIRPSAARMGALSASIANEADPAARDSIAAELAVLRRRNMSANQIVLALLVASAAAMAVGRYVG